MTFEILPSFHALTSVQADASTKDRYELHIARIRKMNERYFSGITFQDAAGEIRHVSYVKGLNDALAYDQSKVAYQLHKAYMRRISSSDYAWIVYRNSINETAWVQWPDMPSTTEN